MTKNHINHAIRDCLAQCQSAANPADQIAAFLTGLRAADWAEDDIHSVEMIVTKTLRAIADTATSRDDGMPRREDPGKT